MRDHPTRGMRIGMRLLGVAGALLLGLALTACISIGRRFSAQAVPQLQVGETTQQQVLETFGPPWRTGIDSGQRTWTYGFYHYALFGSPEARDLVIKFDRRGIVASYSYNTTSQDQ